MWKCTWTNVVTKFIHIDQRYVYYTLCNVYLNLEQTETSLNCTCTCLSVLGLCTNMVIGFMHIDPKIDSNVTESIVFNVWSPDSYTSTQRSILLSVTPCSKSMFWINVLITWLNLLIY